MFRKILIPLEFGAPNEAVLTEAKLLGAPDAEFGLVHVLPSEFSLSLTELGKREAVLKEVESWLGELEGEFAEPARVRSALAEGKPDAQILREADEFGADCIVLGSHGRRGLPRFLLGSVAERVVKAARIPVCIVRGSAEPVVSKGKLARIAFATDLGAPSEAANQVFADLVGATGARGLVVHAFRKDLSWAAQPLPAPYLEGAYWGVTMPAAEIEEHLQTLRSQREGEVDALVKALAAPERDLEAVVLSGDPWDEIASYVSDNEIDLLILGTHHPRGMERLTIGSVAEKILRSVEVPVLVVPHLVS